MTISEGMHFFNHTPLFRTALTILPLSHQTYNLKGATVQAPNVEVFRVLSKKRKKQRCVRVTFGCERHRDLDGGETVDS